MTAIATLPASGPGPRREQFEALISLERGGHLRICGVAAARPRAAAEDVTSLAFERAFRRRAPVRRAPRQRAVGCSRSHATRRSTSCAAASAPARCVTTFADESAEPEEIDAELAERAVARCATASRRHSRAA